MIDNIPFAHDKDNTRDIILTFPEGLSLRPGDTLIIEHSVTSVWSVKVNRVPEKRDPLLEHLRKELRPRDDG